MSSVYESHCCGADKLFDLKGAQKEYKKYLKSGPGRVTQKLIDHLGDYEVKEKSLLDVGGGIGALAWDFHLKGGESTTDVDASHGYLQVAEDHANKMGWSENSSFIFGNITELKIKLDTYDFVTLDKVICCYPDYKSILQSAASRSRAVIGLSFPLGGPVAHIITFFGGLLLKLKKNSFKPYIHSSVEVERFLNDLGFQPVRKTISFPWRVWIFERIQ